MLGPGVGDAAHAGAGKGKAVAVAALGKGRQVHAVGMQPINPAVAASSTSLLRAKMTNINHQALIITLRRGGLENRFGVLWQTGLRQVMSAKNGQSPSKP